MRDDGAAGGVLAGIVGVDQQRIGFTECAVVGQDVFFFDDEFTGCLYRLAHRCGVPRDVVFPRCHEVTLELALFGRARQRGQTFGVAH